MLNKVFLMSTVLFSLVASATPKNLTLRWATPHEPEAVSLIGAYKFKEILEEKTSGRIKVEILSFRKIQGIPDSSTTGTIAASTVVAEMNSGKFDVTQIYFAELALTIPKLNALRLPFLIRSHSHLGNVVNSAIGKDLLDLVAASGITGLGIGYSGGQQVYATTGAKLISPNSFKNVSLRVAGGYPGTESESVALLGSSVIVDSPYANAKEVPPLPRNYPTELIVYKKILNNEADAYGAILTDLFVRDELEKSFLDKIKVVILPKMFFYTSIIGINSALFKNLDIADQQLISDAGVAAAQFERDSVISLESKLIKKLIANKIKVIELTEKEKSILKSAVEPVYKKYINAYGSNIIDAINKKH